MVNLTRIYTRTGDDGTTALGDLSRTRKTDPRLAAYADANEANAAIGVAVACGELPGDVRAVLTRVQNDLFDVGADLSTPLQRSYDYPPLRVKEEWVTELEADCDRYLERLEKLRSFILPGGSAGGARPPPPPPPPPPPAPPRRGGGGAARGGGPRGRRGGVSALPPPAAQQPRRQHHRRP